MTTLRSQLIRELVLRGSSPRTQEACVNAVAGLARHYNRSPDGLSDEQIKAYLFHLHQHRKLAASSLNIVVSGLRCFYQHVLAYSSELSRTYATLAADRFLAHLQRHGIDTRAVEIRTDLGTEFDGETVHLQPRHIMSGQIEQQWQARHDPAPAGPPHCPNPAVAGPTSRPCTPPSSPDTRCRGWKSPVELLAEKAPQALPQNLLASPPAVGVTSYPQGGSRCTGASRIVARKHGIGRSKRAPSRPPIASAWQRWRLALRSR